MAETCIICDRPFRFHEEVQERVCAVCISEWNSNPPTGPALGGRALQAIVLAIRFGGIDGDHHKTWVIDQMTRLIAGDYYKEIRSQYDTWDEGIAPWGVDVNS